MDGTPASRKAALCDDGADESMQVGTKATFALKAGLWFRRGLLFI